MIFKSIFLYLLLSLLVSSSTVLAQRPALADTPLTVGGPVPDTVDNIEVTGSAALKKAGATKVTVFFEAPADGSFTKTAWLLGSKNGKVIWKTRLPVKLDINRAKADVACRKGQIVVSSQSPGSAAYTSQTFSWDGKKAALVGTKMGDPSQDIVNALLKLGEKGTRSQLDSWNDQDHVVIYPGNYVTQANLESILDRGHKTALALDKAGKHALAAERMELCFDASQDLVETAGGASDQTKKPAKWIAAWTADSAPLPASKWTPLLKDYAQFLRKCGKQKQAQNVLAAVNTEAAKTDHAVQAAGDAKETDQH